MKKIISIFMIFTILVSMCSITIAATPDTEVFTTTFDDFPDADDTNYINFTGADSRVINETFLSDFNVKSLYDHSCGGYNGYDPEENELRIIDDDTGSSRGKVMKIVSDNESVFPTVRYTKGSNTPHETDKNLVISTDMYFPAESALGFKIKPDTSSKRDFYNVDDGNTTSKWTSTTESSFSFFSVLKTSSNTPHRQDSVLTLAVDHRSTADWSKPNSIPAYINVPIVDGNYNNVAINSIQELDLPVGKWFNVSFIFDVESFDDLTKKIPLTVFVDGKMVVDNQKIEIVQNRNFDTKYIGLAFSPLSYVSDTNKGECKGVMYFDDISVNYINDYVPELSFISGGASTQTTTDVKTDSTFSIEFESEIGNSNLEKLLQADAIGLCDNNGEKMTIKDIAASGNVLTFATSEAMRYNRTYTLTIPALDMYNSSYIKFNGLTATFGTEKSRGAYITNYTVTPVGGTLDTATSVNIAVTSSEAAKILAASYKNGEFVDAVAADAANTANLTLNGGADYIKLIVIDSNGKTVCDSIVYPENTVLTETPVKDVDSLTLTVTDSVNSVIELAGKTGATGNNQYARVEIYTNKLDTLSAYDKATAIYVDDLTVDVQGRFTKQFTFKKSGGKYYVWTVIDSKEVCTEFDFVSFNELKALVEHLVITDTANINYIPESDIYEEVSLLSSGFGIEFADIYKSERDKSLLEYRMNLRRSELSGLSATDAIAEFITIEGEIRTELNFLNELENPVNKNQIEYLLKANTAITGMDFTNYSSIPSETYVAFIGKTFNNADEIKKFFEDELDKALTPTPIPTPGGGGGGGGGGGVIRPHGATFATQDKNDKTENTELNNDQNFYNPTPFTDIASVEWAGEAITELYNRKIINGIDANSFAPMGDVKREEFVKMLVLASGNTDFNASCDFSDIDINNWSYKFVAAAVNMGLVSGINETTFGLGTSMTRQDVATVVARLLGMENPTEDEIAAARSEENTFADMDNVSDYAVCAVKLLKDNKILLGDDNNMVNPLSAVTRAEAAVIIYRATEFMS